MMARPKWQSKALEYLKAHNLLDAFRVAKQTKRYLDELGNLKGKELLAELPKAEPTLKRISKVARLLGDEPLVQINTFNLAAMRAQVSQIDFDNNVIDAEIESNQ
jgi:hypothetical protein